MNGFVCLLMFVFCVCLTAVVLSGLFANMLVHKRRQACGEAGQGEACQATLQHITWNLYKRQEEHLFMIYIKCVLQILKLFFFNNSGQDIC